MRSFKYASEGIITGLKEEKNLRFHCLMAIVTVILGIYYQISHAEWLALSLTIGLVIALELTNAAIEAIVDSFTDQQHPGAKKAKDIAAGAVLVAALTAVAVGLMIFLPYVFTY